MTKKLPLLSCEFMVKDNTTRAKIIGAASKFFAEKGFEGTSVRDIVNKSKINISMISYYFKNKEGLFVKIIEEYALSAQATFEDNFSKINLDELNKESFTELITLFMKRIIQHRANYPYVCRIIDQEKIHGNNRCKSVFEDIFFPMGEKFAAIIKAAQKKRIVNANIDPKFFFGFMIESIQGYLMMVESHEKKFEKTFFKIKDEKKIIEQLKTIFLEGILC